MPTGPTHAPDRSPVNKVASIDCHTPLPPLPAMPARRARTKTFTGCWTCRKRHVKCDEGRPECLRCQRNGWVCQGYSVRLGWTNTSVGMAQRRRQLGSSTRPSPELSLDTVTGLLAELDQGTGSIEGLQRGPFSVFSVSLSDTPRQSSRENFDFMPVQEDREHETQPSRPLLETETLLEVLESRSVASSFTAPSSPALRISTTHLEILDQPHTAAGVLTRLDLTNPIISISSMPDPTPLPVPEIELIHHWVVFLSGHVLLIDIPDNPCRTVFMPLALEGLNASPQDANIHRAIFHGICAASAFSLFHLSGESRFQYLAVRHDQQALRHLRETLHAGRNLDETTLAAVLSCITAEAMSGRRGRWRAHVAGGLGLLEHAVQGGWTQTASTKRLLQSYLSLSSLCNLPLSPRLASLLNGPPECPYYLERSHGVTPSLVQFLARISVIRESEDEITAAELDSLEMQLYLQFPSAPVSDTTESMLIQHALNSFYYATVIYFRRTLRRAEVADVQDLVEKAVQDLEASERLTHRHGGCAYNWACFVVAAECERPDMQARTLALFESKQRHGIKNIQVLSEVVRTLWQRRRSAGPEVDIHWEEIASQADFDIMLV